MCIISFEKLISFVFFTENRKYYVKNEDLIDIVNEIHVYQNKRKEMTNINFQIKRQVLIYREQPNF